ncbi:TPA: pilus assembly protein [Providencia stuartii]|nr:pilus assembly protein [Providencia stuartii]
MTDIKINNLGVVATLALLLSLSFFSKADGQLMVMPAKSTLVGQENKKVQLSNVGDKALYLNIDLVRIDNPGITPEQKTSLGNIPKPQLMANPAKLTLGPGQKRDINLISLSSPDKETVYRLYVIPVSSINIIGDEPKDKIEAPVSFGIGYGVIVYHLPEKSKQISSWNYSCTAAGMRLISDGNVKVVLNELNEIPKSKKEINEIKLFPNVSQLFSFKNLKGKVDGKPFEVNCQ